MIGARHVVLVGPQPHVRVLGPHPGDQPQPVAHEGKLEHQVAGADLVARLERVLRVGDLGESDRIGRPGADVARIEDVVERRREVDLAATLGLLEREDPEVGVAAPVEIRRTELEFRRQARPDLGERQAGRERDGEIELRVGEIFLEIAEHALAAVGVVAEDEVARAGGVDAVREALVGNVLRRPRERRPPVDVHQREMVLTRELPVVELVLGVGEHRRLGRGAAGLLRRAVADHGFVRTVPIDQRPERQPMRGRDLVGGGEDAAEPGLERAAVEAEVVPDLGIGIVDRTVLNELAIDLVAPRSVLGLVDRRQARAERPPAIADLEARLEVDGSRRRVGLPDVLEGAPQDAALRRRTVGGELVPNDAGELPVVAAEPEVVGLRAFVGVEVLKRGLAVAGGREGEPVGELVREIEQVDVGEAAREVAREIRRVRLHDRDRVDELGRKEVERYDALVGIRARQAAALEDRAAVALAQAAHEDELVVLDGDGGHALHHLGGGGVGRLPDRLRGDVVAHHRGLLALDELRRLGGLRSLRDHLDDLDAGLALRLQRHVGGRDLVRLHDDLLEARTLVERREEPDLIGSRGNLHREAAVEIGANLALQADDLDPGLDDGVTGRRVDHLTGDRPHPRRRGVGGRLATCGSAGYHGGERCQEKHQCHMSIRHQSPTSLEQRPG